MGSESKRITRNDERKIILAEMRFTRTVKEIGNYERTTNSAKQIYSV
jgi:hypothetical protein